MACALSWSRACLAAAITRSALPATSPTSRLSWAMTSRREDVIYEKTQRQDAKAQREPAYNSNSYFASLCRTWMYQCRERRRRGSSRLCVEMSESCAQHRTHTRTHLRRRMHGMDPGGFERAEFLVRRALAARDHGAGMAHAPPGGRGGARDVCCDRPP